MAKITGQESAQRRASSNYSRQDDPELGPAIVRGEIPLFAVKISAEDGIGEHLNSDSYKIEIVVGDPKPNTLDGMIREGMNFIKEKSAVGEKPRGVIVTHNAYGEMHVEPSYSN